MGVYVHNYVSFYSFAMGVLWFSSFVVLSLLLRKLKFSIRFSIFPLLLLVVLSVLRMFIVIEYPSRLIILSETLYPAVYNFLRHELLPYNVFGVSINIVNVLFFTWVTVAVVLVVRYLRAYIGRHGSIINWFEHCERDEYAESLLGEMIGSDKRFRVYRNAGISVAVATAVKPYIILPKIDFPHDELCTVLLHEWKHIQDKDYLTGFIANIICYVFWWNPLAYVLRKNFCFVNELKSDRFAVTKGKGVDTFFNAILLLDKSRKEKEDDFNYSGLDTVISDDDELVDRLTALATMDTSPTKRIITNVVYGILFIGLFVFSYSFIILPATWRAPEVSDVKETFDEIFDDYGHVFIPVENYILDNGDGTYSLYIEGQFVKEYLDDTNEVFTFLPVRKKEVD
ncbi:MAG: hypothetical protein FWG87_00170 [Defluviitaleaceae bacterium]|nr:hypothetical protein [Defluviitaleaceae bacterium]